MWRLLHVSEAAGGRRPLAKNRLRRGGQRAPEPFGEVDCVVRKSIVGTREQPRRGGGVPNFSKRISCFSRGGPLRPKVSRVVRLSKPHCVVSRALPRRLERLPLFPVLRRRRTMGPVGKPAVTTDAPRAIFHFHRRHSARPVILDRLVFSEARHGGGGCRCRSQRHPHSLKPPMACCRAFRHRHADAPPRRSSCQRARKPRRNARDIAEAGLRLCAVSCREDG
jgi:hypothetical protein